MKDYPIRSLVAGVPEHLTEFAHSGKTIDFSYNSLDYRVEYNHGCMHIELISPVQPQTIEKENCDVSTSESV